MKRMWRAKIERTKQELKIEQVEQMLDVMLVEKIMKSGAPKPPTEPGRLDTYRGTSRVYLGEHSAYWTPDGGEETYLGKVTELKEEKRND